MRAAASPDCEQSLTIWLLAFRGGESQASSRRSHKREGVRSTFAAGISEVVARKRVSRGLSALRADLERQTLPIFNGDQATVVVLVGSDQLNR